MTSLESTSRESYWAPPTGRVVEQRDRWSAVSVLDVTVVRHASAAAPTRSLVRAYVQLGAFVPADVRVEAHPGHAAVVPAETTSEGLRLWSVHRFTNGVHLFEAQVPSSAIGDEDGVTVCVLPAPGRTAPPAALPVACWAGPGAATQGMLR